MWFKRSDGILFEVEEGSESHRQMQRDGGFEELPSSPGEMQTQNTTETGQAETRSKPVEKMNVAELRALAKARNITLEGNLSRSQLVALLNGLGG